MGSESLEQLQYCPDSHSISAKQASPFFLDNGGSSFFAESLDQYFVDGPFRLGPGCRIAVLLCTTGQVD
ncbi:hypothetical protein VT98_12482 [Candidatus Electrothrix communis]|uniref:Uncharacterized protein n=1 Tax=Candidatus Electrothrix communis TaxID=1859133 RepID=A0A444J155_9BACT|nr:hypothetical protein VT98_12482 [Candidatus Electrothrix communis]